MGDGSVKVAVVQRPPVLLDRDACVKVAVEAIAEVAAAGAVLAVFPETFIPGYPAWIWDLRPGGDYDLSSEIHARLLDNSIDLSTDELGPVQDAAARNSVVVVCGIHERDGSFSRATVYNTLVTIGADGTVLNRHHRRTHRPDRRRSTARGPRHPLCRHRRVRVGKPAPHAGCRRPLRPTGYLHPHRRPVSPQSD